MKPVIIASTAILMLLTLTFLLPACATFETSIMAMEPKNISINITNGYDISKNASVAMAAQTININSTNPVGNNASLMLMSFNMQGNDTSQINSKEFSNFMETMFLGIYKLVGAKEVSNITVKSSSGQNVSLHTFAMPGTKAAPGKETTFAFWDLNDYIHVIMTSYLDQNLSSRIVETLKIED
jgi:hypothetical protein